MSEEQQKIKDLEDELEFLRQWIRNEYIIRSSDPRLSGTPATEAYKHQRRHHERMWFSVFGEAASVLEWVIEDAKQE